MISMKKKKLITGVIIFLIAFEILYYLIPAADTVAVNTFISDEGLTVITDADDGSVYPADTLFMFNTAAVFGTRGYSLSLIMLADGDLVVAAEDELSVYTLAKGAISGHIYDEINRLNFAYNFTTDGGETYPYRQQMHTCVRFEDLLNSYSYSSYIIRIVQDGQTGIDAAMKVCELIRRAGLEPDTVILGSDEVMEAVRNNSNVHIMTGAKESELKLFRILSALNLTKLIAKPGFGYVEISYDDIDSYSAKLLKDLTSRNIAVYVTGVNREDVYLSVRELKISGILTADPELINGINEIMPY